MTTRRARAAADAVPRIAGNGHDGGRIGDQTGGGAPSSGGEGLQPYRAIIHETDQLGVGVSAQDSSIFERSRMNRISEAVV